MLWGLLAGMAQAAPPAEPTHEVDLVRAALDAPRLRAELAAARARTDASGTARPTLSNPTLDGRREQARGPAGATTDALGGSLTLDLGLSGFTEQRAAVLRAQAGESWLRAEATGAVCAVRSEALAYWLADGQADVASVAHERLLALQTGLDAMAAAGEVAGYDRARSGLSLAAHGHQRDTLEAEATRSRATLAALAGRPVDEVALAAMPASVPLDRSIDEALAADPVLAALRKEREAASRSVAAARRAAVPDLTLTGGARWDSQPDGSGRTPGFEVGAGLELPLFDRNQVEVAERRAALATLDADGARRESEVRAAAEAAWHQVQGLGAAPAPLDVEPVWSGARDRYVAGEASIDELLAVARDIEAAELAALQGAALRRRARLELSCVSGAFPEPEFQALLEELIR